MVSCGKSRRDIDLLASALDDIPALIYAPPQWRCAKRSITVRTVDRIHLHTDVIADMARASVVAIPLRDQDRMLGLSELNDALALGKPVVMTKSPHIDVDVEAIGCGIALAPGDVAGWREALALLTADASLASTMGTRGRAFAESEWNATLCGDQIVTHVAQLATAC